MLILSRKKQWPQSKSYILYIKNKTSSLTTHRLHQNTNIYIKVRKMYCKYVYNEGNSEHWGQLNTHLHIHAHTSEHVWWYVLICIPLHSEVLHEAQDVVCVCLARLCLLVCLYVCVRKCGSVCKCECVREWQAWVDHPAMTESIDQRVSARGKG